MEASANRSKRSGRNIANRFAHSGAANSALESLGDREDKRAENAIQMIAIKTQEACLYLGQLNHAITGGRFDT